MRYFILFLLGVAAIGCSDTARQTSTDVVTSGGDGPTSETAPVEARANEAATDATDESSGDAAMVIDVRSQEEWDSGHIEEAVHIPHEEIANRIDEVTTDKNAKIVVYCAAGRRAGIAKSKLEELGFTNVENGGGIDDMKARAEQE